MTPLPLALLVSLAWAQPNANGEPSRTVQQQQKQADYARKGHPQAGKPQEERASLRTKNGQAKPPKPKKGEASLRTPQK